MNVMVNFGFFYYIIELFFFQGGILAQYTSSVTIGCTSLNLFWIDSKYTYIPANMLME